MQHLRITFVALLALACAARAQTPTPRVSSKLLERLVGNWELSKIYDGQKELDTSRYKKAMKNIEFTVDAKYISTSPQLDSGFFHTNEGNMTVFLENVTGNRLGPKEWNVTLDDNQLVLSRNQPVKAKRYKYVYLKKNPPGKDSSK